MGGYKERTSREKPCIFCGDVGYDMRIHYDNGDVCHWCHKVKVGKGQTVLAGGEEYRCINDAKTIDIGTFALFTRMLSKEEWMAKQARENPNWKPSGKGVYTGQNGSNNSSNKKPAVPVEFKVPVRKEGELSQDECEPLAPEKLDKIYRYFLSLLVLERKHEKLLLDEWQSTIHDVSGLLRKYPIRSFPPEDKASFKLEEKLENPTRKHIVAKLIQRFGSLKGVPGFYMRSGTYWDEKPEAERWTFSSIEGIVFPCYDKNGYLYRIRIRDDYPDMKIKKGKDEAFLGRYGLFHHSYDKDGIRTWSFYPETEDGQERPKPELVYKAGELNNKITLNSKGLPAGKPNGKYKNISSVAEKYVDGKLVNILKFGTRSGSPYSLYCSKGDNFKVVIGTEGEKKAMVANAIKKVPVVCIPGVSSYKVIFKKEQDGKSLIDTLLEKGMKTFILCYDADKEDNPAVLKAEQDFIKELKAYGVNVLIGYWTGKFNKGLDDILLMGLDFKLQNT